MSIDLAESNFYRQSSLSSQLVHDWLNRSFYMKFANRNFEIFDEGPYLNRDEERNDVCSVLRFFGKCLDVYQAKTFGADSCAPGEATAYSRASISEIL